VTTENRPAPRRRSAWPSPRHWSLRVKFSVVLLVPLVLALALGGVRIADLVAHAGERDRISRFVAAQGMVTALVVDVERERYRATEFVANGRGDDRMLQAAVDAVDRRATQARGTVAALAIEAPEIVLVQRQAEQATTQLGPLREVVRRSNAPSSAVLTRYSELLVQLVQLDTTLLRYVNTTDVTGLANGLAGLSEARNEATLQQAQMAVAALEGPMTAPLAAELQFSGARLDSGLSNFRVALDADQRVRYAWVVAGTANAARAELVQATLAGAPAPGVGPVADVYSRFLGELDASAEGLRAELRSAVAEQRRSALVEAWANVVLLALALLVGALIVGLVARGMIASLRTLRRAAITIAEERLPEAVRRMRLGAAPDVDVSSVPVTTREEVGQVARAFDAVHEQAVRLAAEQATLQNNINAMYVNLSRRSQALVDRQLVLIEQLEEGEDDPEQLSDLFRLDHLATRMRRNCENLLVLAGADLPRAAAEPTPVLDVLRAAVSEIEHYQRVLVQNTPDATLAGSAAGDIQHLLAELLDNATNFSPPESQVVMSCSRARDGSILVEIFDDGIGLTPNELAALNERLRHPVEATATVAASRRMGLFVVGRLAGRHDISVGLFTDSLGTSTSAVAQRKHGVVARVTVPAELVGERTTEPDQVVWSRLAPAGGPGPDLPARIVIPPGPAPRLPAPAARDDAEGAGRGAAGSDGAALPPAASPPPPRFDPETTLQMPIVSAASTGADPGGAEPVEPAAPAVPAQVRADAFELFDPLVPPPALPDPAAPRPPDPFATEVDDAEPTPIFTEVSSGWFHVPGRREDAVAERPVPVGAGVAAGRAATPFTTSADAVWQAAQAAHDSQTGGLTSAGLPRRVPRGRLMPGSAGPGEPPPSISGRDPDAVRGRLTTFQRGVRSGRVTRSSDDPDPAAD
jgi:signal transduction histidine kinase